MASFDVLGEDEHRCFGVLAADRHGGAHPFVLVGGRHSHVDDGEVGFVLGNDGEQCFGVADPCEHLVSGVLEEPRESFA